MHPHSHDPPGPPTCPIPSSVSGSPRASAGAAPPGRGCGRGASPGAVSPVPGTGPTHRAGSPQRRHRGVPHPARSGAGGPQQSETERPLPGPAPGPPRTAPPRPRPRSSGDAPPRARGLVPGAPGPSPAPTPRVPIPIPASLPTALSPLLFFPLRLPSRSEDSAASLFPVLSHLRAPPAPDDPRDTTRVGNGSGVRPDQVRPSVPQTPSNGPSGLPFTCNHSCQDHATERSGSVPWATCLLAQGGALDLHVSHW